MAQQDFPPAGETRSDDGGSGPGPPERQPKPRASGVGDGVGQR